MLLLVSLPQCPAQAAAPLHVEAGQFVDAQGRVVILRGVNLAGDAKIPPFMPLQQAALLDPLPGWGFNMIRLLFTWEAYEPQRGQYNAAYLAYYRKIVDWAWQRGLYTLIDFHQDAYARFLLDGCGEGFPEWSIPPEIPRHTPNNQATCSRWFTRVWLNNDVKRAWDAFYRNDHGVAEHYQNMVRRVAKAFATHPGVLGYDLLNEPLGDERRQIAPLYANLAQAIRQVHPTAILFIEPHVSVDVGLPSHLPKPNFDNFAYAPHFYDWWTTLTQYYLGQPFDGPFASMRQQARAFAAPLFLGEFGSTPDTREALAYVHKIYDQLDTFFGSGAQWSYTPGWQPHSKDGWNLEDLSLVDNTGRLRRNFAPRPYAQKIAGKPLTQEVSIDTASQRYRLRLAWAHQPQLGFTEIFAPYRSPTQPLAGVQPSGDVVCQAWSQQRLRCSASTAGVKSVQLLLSNATPQANL